VFTGGGAEAGATVTLFDTNGTTVLGSGLADASGNWSITSSTLAAGGHTLTARQADIAGNTSVASAGLVVTIGSTAAVISGTATGSVTEAGGVNNATAGTPTATGTLTDTDIDNPANTFTAVAAGAATTNGYGTFQMTAGGTWTYTLNDNNATVQALNVGGTLTDTFSVTTVDGTAQLVTVTIHGADDAPVASPVSLTSGTGNTPYTITAAMLLAGVTDV